MLRGEKVQAELDFNAVRSSPAGFEIGQPLSGLSIGIVAMVPNLMFCEPISNITMI